MSDCVVHVNVANLLAKLFNRDGTPEGFRAIQAPWGEDYTMSEYLGVCLS